MKIANIEEKETLPAFQRDIISFCNSRNSHTSMKAQEHLIV